MRDLKVLLVAVMVMLVVTANVMGAGVLLKGTGTTDFIVDYDNAGAGVSQTLTFNRGSTGSDAVITWNESLDQFELNFPLATENGSGIVVGHTAQVSAGGVTAELQALGTSSEDSTAIIGRWSANINGAGGLKFYKSRSGTIGSFATIVSGDNIADISAYADDGTDDDTLSSRIAFDTEGTIGTGRVPGVIKFLTAKDSGDFAIEEAIRITSSQQVGINVNDPDTRLEILNAGDQLKLSFDGTDNAVFAVDTNGDLTITQSGSGMRVAGELVAQTYNFAPDTASDDDYLIALDPVPAAYSTGMMITFTAITANTGACTVNVNSLGVKPLQMLTDQNPPDNFIEAGSVVLAVYDGTNFQMMNEDANP